VCVPVCVCALTYMPTGRKYLALYWLDLRAGSHNIPPSIGLALEESIRVLLPFRFDCLQHCEQADYVLCKRNPVECFHFVSPMVGLH